MYPVKYFLNTDYQEMEILGVKGLFSNLRVERESLPEGFFKYSLREGEEEYFSSIENHVLVNHSGDFICPKKLDLGSEDYWDLGEDYSFTGEPVDVDKFFGVDIKLKVAEALDAFMRDFDPYGYADNLEPCQDDMVDDIRAMLDDQEQSKGILDELNDICNDNRFENEAMAAFARSLVCKMENIVRSFPEKRVDLDDQILSAESQKGKPPAEESQIEPVVS